MPSNSLTKWAGERTDALDEIADAHAIVGGTERGRRYATRQINYSYATLLTSHFQGFCRDLHSECVDHIVAATPTQLRFSFARNSPGTVPWTREIHIPVALATISIGSGFSSGLGSIARTREARAGVNCFKN